jgi:2,3-bisphosphoglycerate-independent phosphoglycerate mutase
MSEATPHSQSLVVQAATPSLRHSLARLDVAARARFVAVGADVEVVVTDVASRLEARARTAVTQALRENALTIVGVALAVAVVAGLFSGPRARSLSRH